MEWEALQRKFLQQKEWKDWEISLYNLLPNSRILAVVCSACTIYQLTAPPPTPIAYRAMYPPPVYNPQYSTHQIDPIPIISRTEHRQIPLKLKPRLPEIFTPLLNHCHNCSKSYGTPTLLLESSWSQWPALCQKVMTSTSVAPITWMPRGRY